MKKTILATDKTGPTPLTPMGMCRELVRQWHEEYFGLKIKEWKLELLASRIADLMVANTLEAIRGLEDYNGKYQIACLEVQRLEAALQRIADRQVEPELKNDATVLSGMAWAALNK